MCLARIATHSASFSCDSPGPRCTWSRPTVAVILGRILVLPRSLPPPVRKTSADHVGYLYLFRNAANDMALCLSSSGIPFSAARTCDRQPHVWERCFAFSDPGPCRKKDLRHLLHALSQRPGKLAGSRNEPGVGLDYQWSLDVRDRPMSRSFF
jgi:hypothetical protein